MNIKKLEILFGIGCLVLSFNVLFLNINVGVWKDEIWNFHLAKPNVGFFDNYINRAKINLQPP